MAGETVITERAITVAPPPTPPPNLTEAMSRTRRAIEDGIRTYAAAIVSMKTKLNENTLVARLPPEVLTEIFLHYSTLERVSFSSRRHDHPRLFPPYTIREYSWLRITHICHHWRTIALASPRLWSTIFVSNNAPCVHAMVERSKRAVLDVHIGRFPTRDALHAALGDGRFAHVRTLEVSAMRTGPGGSASLVTDLIAHVVAPCMRILCVEDATASILDAFEASTMPGLEELEIAGSVVANWTSPLLIAGGLKRLVLSRPCVRRATPTAASQTLTHVVQALENMPLLEHLELRSVLPRGEDLLPEDRVVSLPRLKALKLTDDALACAALLRQLSFPATTPLTLDCHGLSGESDIEPLNAAIASRLFRVGAPTSLLLTACFTADREHNTRLKCWTAELDASPTFLIHTACVDSAIPRPVLDIALSPIVDAVTTFTSLFSTLPLNNLRTLVIDATTTDTLSKDEWVQCCSSMLALRSLSVGRWAEGTLADVLALSISVDGHGIHTEPVKTSTGGEPRILQPFWPSLEDLRLQNVQVRSSAAYDEGAFEDDDGLIARFARAFEERKKSQHPIAELAILACYNVDAIDIESLEKTVGEVEWDGCGGLSPVWDEREPCIGEDDSDEESEYYWGPGLRCGAWDEEEIE